MMKLGDLLRHIDFLSFTGDRDVEIANIQVDSRKIEKQGLFIAVKGTDLDGNQYTPDALSQGAICIVSEFDPVLNPDEDHISWVKVANDRLAASRLAEAFYDYPSRKLKLIGVTGTNGKSTIVNFLYQLFENLGFKTGLFSTIGNRIHNKAIGATLTTPDPVSLSRSLAEMVNEGCDYVFMEVSSHALAQERIAALEFDGGVFTNITRDHLDYHHTFADYIKTKKIFFDNLPQNAFALLNSDDRNGRVMGQNTTARKVTYGVKGMADYKAQILEYDLNSMLLEIDGQEIYTTITGEFNAYNLLATYSVGCLLGVEAREVLRVLSAIKEIPGRLEKVKVVEGKAIGFVDYAHTPDAVEKVGSTLKKLIQGDGRLIIVLGCGGDRDKTKRPLMASAAASNSDIAILTSDNPRNEDPEEILVDMLSQLPPHLLAHTFKVKDRKEAIRMAVSMAADKDVILVAGKGHETYQIVKGRKLPFDDRVVLHEALKEKYKTH